MQQARIYDGRKRTLRWASLCALCLYWSLDIVSCGADQGSTRRDGVRGDSASPKHYLVSLSVSANRRGSSRDPVSPQTTPAEDSEISLKAERLRRRRIFRNSLRIEGLRGPDHVDLFVENLTGHTVTLTMNITFKNLESTEALPLTAVLAAKQRKKVTRLKSIEGSASYRFRYRYQVDMLPGKAKAIPDKDYAYALPYRPGTAYWVVQGYGGKFTHQGRSRYSVDFAMPEGTPIYAAREGVVAETRMDSDASGTTEEHRELANYIIIEHPDGTWAEYYHLRENGVEVKVDEKVQAGQLIGYSGNTGYSKIPHLHFAIRKTISGKVSSTVPVKFNTSQGILSRLRPSRRYRAADSPVE
jgi:murein DD-endopeptidase MepM/ murein hydrolase activator NlpD